MFIIDIVITQIHPSIKLIPFYYYIISDIVIYLTTTSWITNIHSQK